MAILRFTSLPERGDVALGELKTKKVLFLKEDSFNGIADIDLTKYEVLGVVFKRDGNEVKFVYTENALKTWCERYAFKLTGYTLDGTERTGVLTVRTANDWATGVDYTITYQATTMTELVTQLNSYFSANTPFTTQDWVAEVVDDTYVNLHFALTDYRQASNTAKSGFALTANCLPEIPSLANMLRKSGTVGGAGAISSMTKALVYFRNDINSASYNPTSNVTSVKTIYPICLPGYLGTSQYSGGADRCALLREVYGEGEKGWLKFMESCLPVYPTDWGNMGWGADEAARLTRIMAEKRYTSQLKTNEPMCKAAYYADGITRQSLPAHSYRLPSTQEISELLDGVQYNVVNNRNADVLNKVLNKLGGSFVSCSSYFWSAFRYGANFAWYAYGSYGYFYYSGMYGSCVSAPVSLYSLA